MKVSLDHQACVKLAPRRKDRQREIFHIRQTVLDAGHRTHTHPVAHF
jgi:hypothetical protein